MKNNLSLIINAALAIAVVILFILVFKQKSNNVSDDKVLNDSICVAKLPVAYINVDSLLINYEFAKNANESLLKEQENSRLTLNSKARKLQTEAEEFQRKLENQAFLSRQRAEEAQAELMRKQQELQELEGKLSQQLLQKQQKLSEELRDTINVFLAIYNKDKKYQIIFSNTSSDNILYADKEYDITSEVIEQLNLRCSKK